MKIILINRMLLMLNDFWSSKVLVPTIDSNGGSFITIASVSGLRPRPG